MRNRTGDLIEVSYPVVGHSRGAENFLGLSADAGSLLGDLSQFLEMFGAEFLEDAPLNIIGRKLNAFGGERRGQSDVASVQDLSPLRILADAGDLHDVELFFFVG